MEIRIFARQGESIRQISRRTELSRNTVRRYLRDEAARRYGPRALRACKLDPFVEYLQERVDQARPDWIPATVLLREIQERGYPGGISQLKAYLAPFKQSAAEPLVRFETAPGRQHRGATRLAAQAPGAYRAKVDQLVEYVSEGGVRMLIAVGSVAATLAGLIGAWIARPFGSGDTRSSTETVP